MEIPIRMIRIVTAFFWIFLFAILITAAYSAKDLQLSFGQPQLGTSLDNKLFVSIPITIINKGLYNVDYLNVTTKILDQEGFEITNGSTFIPVIEKGQQVTATHNMTVDVNDLVQRNRNYLFNDTTLEINEIGSIRIAGIIPVEASMNISMPWGAPLYNFTLGQYRYILVNYTYVSVTIPISFDNHASFDLNGNIQTRMYNNTDGLIGVGLTDIDVLQNSPYNGQIEFVVQTKEMTESGHFEVYLHTSFFDYGPIVIPYG
jgi:hypothetical protein